MEENEISEAFYKEVLAPTPEAIKNRELIMELNILADCQDAVMTEIESRMKFCDLSNLKQAHEVNKDVVRSFSRATGDKLESYFIFMDKLRKESIKLSKQMIR